MAQPHSKSWLQNLGRRVAQQSRSQLKTAMRTTHNRIVTCGVVALLLFLPSWLRSVGNSILHGSSDFLLNLGFTYLGCDILWQNRKSLIAETVTDEEQFLGYILILGGMICFPFFLSSVSFQALISMVILIGIAICNWGLIALQKYPLAVSLIVISLYPDLGFLGNTIRKNLTGQQLESLMAWMGSVGLSAIGQPVSVQGPILSLSPNLDPKKAVEVASGCSGFDMAFPIAGFGFIMGLYFKRSWRRILALMTIGVTLALLANVPRIMLLAFAVVYWGKASFEFWHGPIGGQIFATLLLTLYYYVAMALVHPNTPKQQAKT